MALKNRGFTLLEIIIYMALSAAALSILTALVTVARRTGDHTYAQYLVSGNMATTVRYIRKELQATALASVTSYGEGGGQSPGFSCVSAYGNDGEFKLGPYGTPDWQKHVYYTLDAKGAVTRSTKDFTTPSYLPTLAPLPVPTDQARVLMHDALPPKTAVGSHHPASDFGGLEVGFVRRKAGVDSISYDNPRESNEPAENTRLVEVVLRTLEDGPNFLEIKFRVAPRF